MQGVDISITRLHWDYFPLSFIYRHPMGAGRNLNIVVLYNALIAKVLDEVGMASPTSEKELWWEWEAPGHAASSRDAACKL